MSGNGRHRHSEPAVQCTLLGIWHKTKTFYEFTERHDLFKNEIKLSSASVRAERHSHFYGEESTTLRPNHIFLSSNERALWCVTVNFFYAIFRAHRTNREPMLRFYWNCLADGIMPKKNSFLAIIFQDSETKFRGS